MVQVSRWDALKDPVGVVNGFACLTERDEGDAELVLASPNVHAVADDPEGAQVYGEVCAAWRTLPHVAENGAIVNALQRHAGVAARLCWIDRSTRRRLAANPLPTPGPGGRSDLEARGDGCRPLEILV